NSTDISRASNEIESSQSSLEQSKSALLPNLTFNINQNLSSSQNYDADTDDWNSNSNTNFSLNSSITLYNGTKLLNSIRQKKTELSASELEIQTEKEILSLEILTAYIDVLLAEEQFKNSKDQLQTTEKQVEYAEAKKAAGIISNADYLNIKSQLASDKATHITDKSQLRISYVSLMQTMDMPMQDSLDIVTPDMENLLNDKLEFTSEEIYNAALEIRSEVKTANLNLESSKLEIKITKADYLPSLKLNGSLNTDYTDALSEVGFGEQFENQLNSSIGLSLSIPIFQQKQVKNQVIQARISAKNSELSLIDIKNSLRKNIEQAYTDAIVAEMQYRASTEQLQAEQESYLLAEEMFSQGLINSVDYLSSKDNYMDAESSLTQTKFNLILKTKVIEYYLGKPIKL
nr:TolC family protein [bacterium]